VDRSLSAVQFFGDGLGRHVLPIELGYGGDQLCW
jgi:hypothetical protein